MKEIKFISVESIVANALVYAHKKTDGKINNIQISDIKKYAQKICEQVEHKYNCNVVLNANEYAFNNFIIRNSDFYEVKNSKLILKAIPEYDVNKTLTFPLTEYFREFVQDVDMLKSYTQKTAAEGFEQAQ